MSHSVVYCPRASQQGSGNSIQFAYNRYQELNYLNHQHCLPRSKLVRTWSQKAVIQPRYSNMVQGFITARPNVHPYPSLSHKSWQCFHFAWNALLYPTSWLTCRMFYLLCAPGFIILYTLNVIWLMRRKPPPNILVMRRGQLWNS